MKPYILKSTPNCRTDRWPLSRCCASASMDKFRRAAVAPRPLAAGRYYSTVDPVEFFGKLTILYGGLVVVVEGIKYLADYRCCRTDIALHKLMKEVVEERNGRTEVAVIERPN